MVRGNTVHLIFRAKSGQEWEFDITDPDLATVMGMLKRRGGSARLLVWKGGQAWHPVHEKQINGHVRKQTGGEFTAQDFRTLYGTTATAISLA